MENPRDVDLVRRCPRALTVHIASLAAFAVVSAKDGRTAHANGAFPSAGQIVVHPADPLRMWVRTDFGIAVSSDGGAHFRMLCREGVGYGSATRPSLAVTPTGKLVATATMGLAVGSSDGCSFARAVELEGQDVGDVSQHPGGATFVSVRPMQGAARVYVSHDDAVSWQSLPAALPLKLVPLTLDAAPSDPDRVYVSGTTGNPAAPVGSFVRSTDGGATWTEILVPGSTLATAPFIAAVDPLDPDRVYVRLHGAPGRLLVTTDAGDTWEEVFVGAGFLRAFALSPDGSVAFVGGEADGILRADAPDLDFAPLSDFPARCLRALADDVVYACGSEVQQGYGVAKSTDAGASFAPFFTQKCLAGPICDPGSPVGDACIPGWPELAAQIGVVACGEGGGGGAPSATNAGPANSTGAGGPSATQGSSVAVSGSSAGAGTGGEGGAGEPGKGDGCGCVVADGEEGGVALLAAVVMGTTAMRRSRRRSSSRRCRRES